MELTSSTLVTILAVIGLLALIVSVITEVTRSVALLAKIPANLQVIVLSLTLTIVTYFAYISYSGEAVIWYHVIATVITGFIVAYVVLFGWDKLTNLYKKFRNIPLIDITADTIQGTDSAKSITLISKKAKSLTSDTALTDTFSTDTSVIDTSDTANTLATEASKTDTKVADV